MSHKEKHAPAESRDSGKDQVLRLKGRPPEGKKVKKEISRLWKSVRQKLEQGEAPTAAEERALVSALADYSVFSELDWRDEWLVCSAMVRQAMDCARKGKIAEAGVYAEEVNRLTKVCHKKYK